MLFNISHEKNGVYQTLLVEARSQELAESYFREQKPTNRFIGIHEARAEDYKPGKPLMVVPEGYGVDRRLYEILYEDNGRHTSVFVEARTKDIAKAYFEAQRPGDYPIWVESARPDVVKHGVRFWAVPDDFSLEFIRGRMLAFNEKMAELENQGFRSGGWDEKTDKTAIVKVGKTWNDNRIVGYMDRELNIEWQTKVLSVGRADAHYLEGIVFVEGEVYPFDYNVETEAVEVYCYSEAGWITGASYEKPLPEVVAKNMDDILAAIDDAVHEFLEVEELKKEQGLTVDGLIDDAKAKADGVKSNGKEFEIDR